MAIQTAWTIYHACDIVKFRQTIEGDNEFLQINQVVDVFQSS